MRLTDEERAMLAGELGEPRRWAIAHQIAVGEFFDAADFVPVSQAHIMADTESLGEAGVRFLEGLAGAPEAERRVRVPTITDPRGIDFTVYRRLGQSEWMAALEQPGDRRPARVRRADDRYLHQLSDDHGADARRPSRLWRHRGRDLFEQRARRAQQFRGRAFGAGRGVDRPHPALWLSPRRMPPRHQAVPADRQAARLQRMGALSVASSARPAAPIGRCR